MVKKRKKENFLIKPVQEVIEQAQQVKHTASVLKTGKHD